MAFKLDNTEAISIADSQTDGPRPKHIDIRVNYFRNLIVDDNKCKCNF